MLYWDLGALYGSQNIRTGDSPLDRRARRTNFPFRALRYWHAGCLIAEEARRHEREVTVIDFGCKRGTQKDVIDDPGNIRWVGLDWKLNAESLQDQGYAEVHQSDFDKPLPLADGSGDIAVSLHVFEHLPRPDFSLAEIRRVLKPGGLVIIGTPILPLPAAIIRNRQFKEMHRTGKKVLGKHIQAFSPGRWKRLLREGGVELEDCFGSHFYRQSGSPLENKEWWVRLNQLWGILLPGLGRDFIIVGRKKG